jgi:hypothetical protein
MFFDVGISLLVIATGITPLQDPKNTLIADAGL